MMCKAYNHNDIPQEWKIDPSDFSIHKAMLQKMKYACNGLLIKHKIGNDKMLSKNIQDPSSTKYDLPFKVLWLIVEGLLLYKG